jgi:hypothetical protein
LTTQPATSSNPRNNPMKMRRYDIVSGILLILSIIDFALAAPVPVQEKRQACVDVMHIPEGVTTVLGKRGAEDDLEHVVEEYFKTVDSSDAHASSNSAPGPDRGSTNVVQAPAPNPAPSTANPGLLMEPSSPMSTASSAKGVLGDSDALSKSDDWWSQSYEGDGGLHDVPLDIPASSEYGSDPGLTGAHAPLPKLPNPNPGLSTDPESGMSLLQPPRPASQTEFGQTHGYQVEHVLQPNAGPASTGADPDFDWEHWANAPSPPRPVPSKPTNPKPSIKAGVKLKNWMNRLNLKDPLALRPASSKPSKPKPSTDSGVNWKHWVNPLNLMDPLAPRPVAPLKLSNPKPTTNSDVNWKHWINPLNLMDPLAPGAAASLKPSNPKPSTDSDFDWEGWSNLKDSPPSGASSSKSSNPKPTTNSDVNWKHWINPLNLIDPLASRPAASLKPSNPEPSTDSDFDWEHWSNLKDSPPSGPASSKSSNPKSWDYWLRLLDPAPLPRPGWSKDSKPSNPKPSYPGPSNPGPSKVLQPPQPLKAGLPKIGPPPSPDSDSELTLNLGPLKEPEDEVVPGPPSTPDPELHSDHQSLSAGNQGEDIQAAVYAAKGKAKESRSIAGISRDVGNAAQRELQPDETEGLDLVY